MEVRTSNVNRLRGFTLEIQGRGELKKVLMD